MAMEERRVSVRERRALTDNDIAEALNDSELDFSGNESDEDPEYAPPELNQRANKHDTSDSSSSDEDETTLANSAASPAFSSSSNIALFSSWSRSRGRARIVSRGRGLRRGSNLSESTSRHPSSPLSTRQIPIRNRQNNDGFQNTWIKDTLDTEVNELRQPSYIHQETKNWKWAQFYDQYIDDDILTAIVTNRTHILETGKSMDLSIYIYLYV